MGVTVPKQKKGALTGKRIGAVLVTRPGGLDLEPIVATFPEEWPVLIWRNGERFEYRTGPGEWEISDGGADLGVFGRYAGVSVLRAFGADVVYVQDDDCLIDVEKVAGEYMPGRLVANMPQSRWADYPDSTMVGWGAVFDSNLPHRAFDWWRSAYPSCDVKQFERTCDVVFSALTSRTVIDVGFSHLPYAEQDDRMHRQPGHKAERDLMLDLCRRLRNGADDDVRRVTV